MKLSPAQLRTLRDVAASEARGALFRTIDNYAPTAKLADLGLVTVHGRGHVTLKLTDAGRAVLMKVSP